MLKLKIFKLVLLLTLALIAGCAPVRPPKPVDPPKPAPKYVHVVLRQADTVVRPTSSALELDDATTRACTTLDNDMVSCGLPDYAQYGWGAHLTATVGDQTERIDFYLAADVNLVFPDGHFDPSQVPLEELVRIRGAMWTETWGCPLGPRPWQGDNVCATDFLWNYDEGTRLAIVQHLRSLGYTHAVVGPIVDSDGYHGSWTPNDWTQKFDQFLDQAQFLWDHGLAPVVFIHPDNWTLEQTQGLTGLFQSPRAQKLLRIIIPSGWEPTKYDWSNATWIEYAKWGRQVFPNAIIGIHTVCDVDAPVGTDARGDDNGRLPNAEAWGRISPYLHFWLTQSCTFENPDGHDDPPFSNFQNWTRLFDLSVRGSYADRFVHGYAGWPMFSAWGGSPIWVCAGEYYSYPVFWQHAPRETARVWGDSTLAPCYLDGGTRSLGPVSWAK